MFSCSVDFRAEPKTAPSSKQPISESPKQTAFKRETSNNSSTDSSASNLLSSSCSVQPRLEQGNADKYREILKNAGYLLINGQVLKFNSLNQIQRKFLIIKINKN